MMCSVPLCLWLGLALLLRTFPLGADERMDSSLIKRAAAGVEPTGVGWGCCHYCPSSLCDTWVFPYFINGYILCAQYMYLTHTGASSAMGVSDFVAYVLSPLSTGLLEHISHSPALRPFAGLSLSLGF